MVGKILVVDDVATNRIVLKVKLTEAGYHPLLAQDGATALALATREQPNLILLDAQLPDLDGAAMLRRLRAEPATRSIPVIVLVGSEQSDALRANIFRAGADAFLTKPMDDQTLLARIRSLIRDADQMEGLAQDRGKLAVLGFAEAMPALERPGLLALITATPERGLLLRHALAGFSHDRIALMSPEICLHSGKIEGKAPDIFLIDSDLATASAGLRLMSELRSRADTRNALFCILFPETAQISRAMAFDLGANELIESKTGPEEIALRLSRLLVRKREADRLRASVRQGLRMAVIDPLTGLHNRRYGLAQLAAIHTASRVNQRPYAVLIVDLDRFKAVNDRHGHAAGDAVLIEVAARLRSGLREQDLLARIGGEEFLIALPDVSLAEARRIAERLGEAIRSSAISLNENSPLHITVSIGLAISSIGDDHADIDAVSQIVARADHALLASKSAGRNKITISRTAA